ncbi:MAG: fibronectin type III domain-containing protein [Flavobacteriales bacterium]|nr:fibronectin type III domain-containing protein [Flavobacteriales bacterium]
MERKTTSSLRKTTTPLLLLLTTTLLAQAPGAWVPMQEALLAGRGERRIIPNHYRTLAVDTGAIRAMLLQAPFGDVRSSPAVIELPSPDRDGTERFRFVRNTLLHPELAALFPSITTCSGESIDRPGTLIQFDLTTHGFHAFVLDPIRGDWFIDPYAFGVAEACIVYRKRDFVKSMPAAMACDYDLVNDMENAAQWTMDNVLAEGAPRAGDCQKRTYRLALACTGEYANYHGSNTQNNNKGPALEAMATTMNRVNGIYERDATLTMQMVANNHLIVFLNPSTDPYSNNNGGTMLGQNQTTCDNIIGFNNYDIGHVFSTGGGGVAYLDAPCSSYKAGGVTGLSQPVGDPFDIDYVAHEMGHQYGANHTQNNSCNRHGPAAFEPGSASTIMGYAGICAPNVQNNSDALFHAHSLAEIASRLASGNAGQCPQVTSSNNQPPTISAGPNRTIPHSTPFVLTATSSDPNPADVLSFTWEQMNNQVSTQPPQPTNTNGPNFRALLPVESSSRWFPNLGAVVANQNPTWEVLSSVGRTFNFRATVRDNRPGAGCTAESNRNITVAAGAGPFVVTQPNTNVSWQAGSTQTVTWNVANTTASPVSCANVDILLSVDGGLTYPYTLLTSTPNDGTQAVTIPVVPATSTARIMVRGNGNVFYDISNVNFNIISGSTCPTPWDLTITGTSTTSVLASWSAGGGDSFTLRYRPVGAPNWTNISGITGTSQAVSGLAACTQYEFQVRRDCGGSSSAYTNSVNWLHSSCCTPVTIVIVMDRYGADITWALTGGSTTYATGGPYQDQASNGTYPQPSVDLCLPDGCYVLTINDSWGDGLCCAYGNGFMQVMGPGGQSLGITPSGNWSQQVINFCVSTEVKSNVKLFLEGPYVGPWMSDALRAGGLIPLQEPYSGLGWPQLGGGGETTTPAILAVTGANAVVDWVRLELRQAGSPGTLVATRQALLQRDGDVVSAADGTSAVGFVVPPGNYHLVAQHRNHLGCMTATALAFSSTANSIDLTLAGTNTWGTDARKIIGSARALWAGDVNGDGAIRYTGQGNDRDLILQAIGGTVPTTTVAGYSVSDVNMDGIIKYTGQGNDRDPMLVNIGGSVPTNQRFQQIP